MSPGTPRRARRPEERPVRRRPRSPTRRNGGFTFAERPEIAAPDARIVWHAAFDPGTLQVAAQPTDGSDPDGIDPRDLARWLTLVVDAEGRERAVVSDGYRHIRLDIDQGSLAGARPVVLQYRLHGVLSALPKLRSLRQFLHLLRHGQFSPALFPADRRTHRAILVLRVHDALTAGASQREIAEVLFGVDRVARDWRDPSDSLRSQIRRLVREARVMARGGYRESLRQPRR